MISLSQGVKTALINSLILGSPALIVAAAATVVSWARDLNASARRTRVIDEATKRVAFWKLWAEAQTSFGGDAEDTVREIQLELADASESVRRTRGLKWNAGITRYPRLRSFFAAYPVRRSLRFYQTLVWAYLPVIVIIPIQGYYRLHRHFSYEQLVAFVSIELASLLGVTFSRRRLEYMGNRTALEWAHQELSKEE